MGTWAEGNFASDGALDYVHDLMDQLIATIEDSFKDGNADLDEGGESELVPSVALLRAISKASGAAPPDPKVIGRWRKKYLKIYDKQIDGLAPDPTFKIKRRAVIDRTFRDLESFATQYYRRAN